MNNSVSNDNRLPQPALPAYTESPSIVGSKVALKINESNLSGKIYSGKRDKSYFDIRPLKLLFVKHVKVNVKIGNAVWPVLFKKSELKQALGVSEKELNALLAMQDGELESVVRKNEEMLKLPIEDRTFFFKTAKYSKEIRKLDDGQILDKGSYLLHKSSDGKPRVYRDVNTKLGEGSYKMVTLFDRVKGSGFKKMAFAEVKLTRDQRKNERHIAEANEEFFQGQDFYDNYKKEYGKEAIPFCKYYLAKDCSQKVVQEKPGALSTIKKYADKLHLTKGQAQNRAEEQPASFGFMMEYADTDLKHADMTPEQKGDVFLGVLRGVAHMHRSRIVHRDLKPDNILLKTVERDGEQHFQPKIIDFGLASKIGDPYRYAGTRTYSPPEAFNSRLYRGDLTKFDSWSLGVILYKMHYGKDVPFKKYIERNYPKNELASEELHKSIIERMKLDVDYLASKEEKDAVEETILHLLDSNPTNRWSVEEALSYLQEAHDTAGTLRIGN